MSDIKYYLIHGRNNVVRERDDVLSYLNHETGMWVPSNTLFDAVTFEASTVEVTEKEAQDWVKTSVPTIDPIWVDGIDS